MTVTHLYGARKILLRLLREKKHKLTRAETRALRCVLSRTYVGGSCGLCGKVMEN
jgi:hypothetical protein